MTSFISKTATAVMGVLVVKQAGALQIDDSSSDDDYLSYADDDDNFVIQPQSIEEVPGENYRCTQIQTEGPEGVINPVTQLPKVRTLEYHTEEGVGTCYEHRRFANSSYQCEKTAESQHGPYKFKIIPTYGPRYWLLNCNSSRPGDKSLTNPGMPPPIKNFALRGPLVPAKPKKNKARSTGRASSNARLRSRHQMAG
jgi:hypothetical protein